MLIPEILGFSPQLLLDDIINISNNAVQDGVNGMEEFLEKWVDERAKRQGDDWDSTQEVEQGLVAFQTLLEHHTDLAFDFFEAWSLRNIFVVPLDLPIVVPHQQNLDLTHPPEREQELMDELEDLRKQLDNLLDKAESGGAGGKSVVDTLMERVHEIGRAEQLRTAVEAMGGVRADLDAVDSSKGDDGMEE
ncbi:hypothetical protein H0H87_010657 [Tephrocybe sp. NHM501043]|nr:hypothetical protein H0H87_010657 [Tephrocybe sp. NHM501043]